MSMFIEKKLNDSEHTIFTQFLKKLNATPHDVCDFTCTAGTKQYCLDVIALDELLDKAVPEYDCEKAIYKGYPISTADVVRAEYGEKVLSIISKLI